MDPPPIVPVKDLRPGLKNLTMVLITLDIGKPSTTKDGHEVRSIRVADRTGSVNLSIWDEPGTLLQPGDIIRIHKAYASLFKNSLTLYIGKGGEIYKVGDFCLHFSETPNMSEESFTNPAAVGGGPDGGGSGAGQGQQGGGGRGASGSSSGPSSLEGGGKGPVGGPRGERPGPGGGGSGGGAYLANNNHGAANMRMGMPLGGGGMGMKAHGVGGPLSNHYNNHNNNFHMQQQPYPLHHHHNNPHNNLAAAVGGGALSPPDQMITQNGVKLHRK